MPHIDIKIIRAYRQSGESGRVHYIVARNDGSHRRLNIDRATNRGLHHLPNEQLLAQGYSGTKANPDAASR